MCLLSLACKIAIAVVVVVSIGGLTTTVVLVTRDGAGAEFPGATGDTGTTEAPSVSTEAPAAAEDMPYEVGVGIADMTGPCTEITFMGYADFGQSGRGVHMRQYARAFVFVRGGVRLVLVSADVQSIGIAVRRQVVQNLQELYGSIYSLRNVILTGTHTHSAPGGYLVDFLLDVSIRGFSRETYDAYVDGITRSIVRAHENMSPARLFLSHATVANAHMNRSPYSYDQNPAEERARYTSNVDNLLTQIRVERPDGTLHGVLSWFAVHTTSMNMTNRLISPDNLGVAAVTVERALNPGLPTGKPEIVAAFFSSNLGDVSPNIRGARCEFSGDQCDNQFQLCAAGERCYSLGPGDDMYQSTRIVGEAVAAGAMEALSSPGEELLGELGVMHQFVEFETEEVARYDPVLRRFNESERVRGCPAAMGYSFASGTVDGANTLDITQGMVEGSPLLDSITGLVATPTDAQRACHAPKPILLFTGRANFPIPWHPRVVSASLIYLGGAVIAGVPGEPTTMAGRRVRDALSAALDVPANRVIVSGLTNEYIHYVATFEEYQVQRYEAASTIYGPHTLDILLNKYVELAEAFLQGADVEAGPTPADYRNSTLGVRTGVLYDAAGAGREFGDVLRQPPPAVRRGSTVSVQFVGASPRNDLRHEGTYAAVERREADRWTELATDADFDTKFIWSRTSTLRATSAVTIEWDVPRDAMYTAHRIRYYGAAKSLTGDTMQFQGLTQEFSVV